MVFHVFKGMTLLNKPESRAPKGDLHKVRLILGTVVHYVLWFAQTWIPFIQGCVVPGLVKIVIIKCDIFQNFKICFPLVKGCGPLFQEIWIPFTQGCFLPSLAVWFWRRLFSFNVFTISLLSLLERGYGPLFEQTRMHSIYTGYPLPKS